MNSYVKYLYVMKLLDDTDPPLYKIGYCSLDKKRLGEYTLLPYEVEYTFVYKSIHAEFLEGRLHYQFANKRVRGEWFRLSKKEIIALKRTCLREEGEIINLNDDIVSSTQIIPVNNEKSYNLISGYESFYIIRYIYGKYCEQSIVDTPYFKGTINEIRKAFPEKIFKNTCFARTRLDEVPDDTIFKYYPQLGMTNWQIRSPYNNFAHNTCGDNFSVKFFGRSRKECLEKALNMTKTELGFLKKYKPDNKKRNIEVEICYRLLVSKLSEEL